MPAPDITAVVKALEDAPRPPNVDPVEYMDWYFRVRGAALSSLKEQTNG